MKKFSQLETRTYWGTEAAGILPICTKTKRLLIALRSEDVMEPNTYGIFGGKLDDDEKDVKKVAIRELFEETEFNAAITLIPAYIFEDSNFKYHNFLGLVIEEFEPILNWENSDAKWLTFDEVLKLPNKHYGLKALLKESYDLILKHTT